MATFETTTTPSLFGRIGGTFSALFAAAVEWNEKRMTRKALEQLSDRELLDIGINRADITSLR